MSMLFSKSKFGGAMIARAATAVAIVLGAAHPALPQPMTLEGTWLVSTQTRNCTTDVPVGAPHRAIVTFHAGGTLSDSSAVPAFAVGQRSEGHGIWNHNGGHTYSARWVAMLTFDTPNPTPGSAAFKAGWQVATNTISLTGPDSFTSVGVSEFVDLGGQVYQVGCASRIAKRFN